MKLWVSLLLRGLLLLVIYSLSRFVYSLTKFVFDSRNDTRYWKLVDDVLEICDSKYRPILSDWSKNIWHFSDLA